MEDWLARCCELVDKYRPQVFYFDWWIQQVVATPYIQRFAAYYYNKGQEWGQGVAINHKHHAFPDGTTVFDVERGQLTEIRSELWQTCTSVMRNSWCVIDEPIYKPSSEILHDLIDIVSKNGTLLLNIGPRADGTIPEGDQAILRDVGAWLAVNGEAIYGTRPFKSFGEGPTKVAEGQFQDANRIPFTAQDIRFTTKGDTLYAIALGMPSDGMITIPSLGTARDLYPGTIGQVELLGSSAPVTFTRDADALRITLPPDVAPALALAFKISA